MTTEAKQAEQKSNFATQRIYIKSSSIEAPLLPHIYKETVTPKIDMKVETNYTEIEPKIYEAVLTLDITNKAEKTDTSDERVLWQIKLQQAGIFTIDGFPNEQLEPALYGFCMNILYPYACEAVSGMTVKSGFAPAYLIPMNFEALYHEQKRRQEEEAKKNPAKANGTNGAMLNVEKGAFA
jgi:preprotein translocase subunit SecB